MRFFSKAKDGGLESTVDAFFLFEIKWLCSIALLRFNKGSRENYHSHAFNAWTWFIKGDLTEHRVFQNKQHPVETKYSLSLKPKFTPRNNLHKVMARKTSWCFTIRGPWSREWTEYNDKTMETTVLTHGRKIVHSHKG